MQLSGHQLTAEEKEVDEGRLGDQHLEKIYRQEESAGARKRRWQPTVCAGETCCPLFHKGLEDLSAKCKCLKLIWNQNRILHYCKKDQKYNYYDRYVEVTEPAIYCWTFAKTIKFWVSGMTSQTNCKIDKYQMWIVTCYRTDLFVSKMNSFLRITCSV